MSDRKYILIRKARKAFPKGLPMSHLRDELVMPGPDEDPEKPAIPRLPELLVPLQPYIEDYYGPNHFKWEEHHHQLPFRAFKHFTTDEKLRVAHSSCLCSDLKEEMEGNVRYTHFDKLISSIWHWGHTDSYATLVRLYNGVRRFDFGVEGFETRFDHTSHSNEIGYANYHRNVFLDGELAYMIYHKGKHVLSIGFSPCKKGVLIAQAQCVNKRGNRWLYKLPQPLLAHIVTRFQTAFPEEILWITDGKSLAKSIEANYAESAHKTWAKPIPPAETLQHIANVYNVPIPGFVKGEEYQRQGVTFHKLTPTKTMPRKQIIEKDEFEIRTKTFDLFFAHDERRTSGYGFRCDEEGNVLTEDLNPAALENYNKCLSGEIKVILPGQIREWTSTERLCGCGSGKAREELCDARGIFCAYVCTSCEKETRARYRLDVMTNPHYEADEPIEVEA